MPKIKYTKQTRNSDFFNLYNCAQFAWHRMSLQGEPKTSVFYYKMICIVFSALALEAMANVCCQQLFQNWKDAKSSSTINKLRSIFSTLNATWDDTKSPFSDVIWLIAVRHKIAHTKPNTTTEEGIIEEADLDITENLLSDVGSEITLDNATRAITKVYDLKNLLFKIMPTDKRDVLVLNGSLTTWVKLDEHTDKTDTN